MRICCPKIAVYQAPRVLPSGSAGQAFDPVNDGLKVFNKDNAC